VINFLLFFSFISKLFSRSYLRKMFYYRIKNFFYSDYQPRFINQFIKLKWVFFRFIFLVKKKKFKRKFKKLLNFQSFPFYFERTNDSLLAMRFNFLIKELRKSPGAELDPRLLKGKKRYLSI